MSLNTIIMITPFSSRQICHQKLRLQYGDYLITTLQHIVISIIEGFEVQQAVLDAHMELKRQSMFSEIVSLKKENMTAVRNNMELGCITEWI